MRYELIFLSGKVVLTNILEQAERWRAVLILDHHQKYVRKNVFGDLANTYSDYVKFSQNRPTLVQLVAQFVER